MERTHRTMRRFGVGLLLVFLTVGAFACGILGPDLDTVGTVGFSNIEGGCWSITTEKENFQPWNLAEDFRVPGLRVRFKANRIKDAATFCPGVAIRLESIVRAD